jgi:hypothetical protein
MHPRALFRPGFFYYYSAAGNTEQGRLKTISLDGNIYGTWRRNVECTDGEVISSNFIKSGTRHGGYGDRH